MGFFFSWILSQIYFLLNQLVLQNMKERAYKIWYQQKSFILWKSSLNKENSNETVLLELIFYYCSFQCKSETSFHLIHPFHPSKSNSMILQMLQMTTTDLISWGIQKSTRLKKEPSTLFFFCASNFFFFWKLLDLYFQNESKF